MSIQYKLSEKLVEDLFAILTKDPTTLFIKNERRVKVSLQAPLKFDNDLYLDFGCYKKCHCPKEVLSLYEK
jgi:hypothetical protein